MADLPSDPLPDLLPDATVRYDEHDQAVIDLHLPPGTPDGRVVVYVHGGFWKHEWDRTHARPLARALAQEGVVVASVEYRRVRGGGGWPTTGDDVRRAVDALPGLLEDLDLPCTSVRTVGHSAGGHLVLWLAATGHAAERTVALAPVADLREADRLHLGEDATAALLGDRPPEEADPMTLLDRGRPDHPVHVVHGVDDANVPLSLSTGLVARHPWVELHRTPGAHFEVIEPGSVAWPTVREVVLGG